MKKISNFCYEDLFETDAYGIVDLLNKSWSYPDCNLNLILIVNSDSVVLKALSHEREIKLEEIKKYPTNIESKIEMIQSAIQLIKNFEILVRNFDEKYSSKLNAILEENNLIQ